MNSKFLLSIFAIVCLMIALMAIMQHRIGIHSSQDSLANAFINLQNPISIQRINVLKGDEFDLLLSDNRRIHAVLDVRATPESKHKVLDFLNKCKNPRIIMRKQVDHTWLVQMYVTTTDVDGNEVEVDLAHWLKDKNLAYE